MSSASKNHRKRAKAWAAAALAGLLLVGCAAPRLEGRAAPSASEPWVPPRAETRAAPAQPPAFQLPEGLDSRTWGLADVLDVALRNNPATRAAWFDARAAAQRLGMADAAYYPRLGLDLSTNYKATRRSDLEDSYGQATWGGALGLTWLVLDFGARDAASQNALATLEAANWTQNRAIQDVIYGTQRAYYLYLASKALRDARTVSLERAEANLASAQARHEAGVATIADALIAKTAVSQARLALETARGAIETTRGALASAMGLPANLAFDIEEMPKDIPYDTVSAKLEDLIATSLAARPDLAAARARVAAAEAAVRKAQGEGLPTLSAVGSAGSAVFAMDESRANTSPDRREDTLSAGLVLSFPLFTGFSASHNVERAKEEAQAAAERARDLEQQAIYQVYAAYHTLRTAAEKVRAAADLLASAEQSENVAAGRYREGVGTALDLISAQAALADARTQGIAARWEWHTALAQLAHDAGILNLRAGADFPASGK